MPYHAPARSSTVLMMAVSGTTSNTGCELSTTQWHSPDRVPKAVALGRIVVGRLHPVAGSEARKRCKFPLDKQYRIYFDVILCNALAADECQSVLHHVNGTCRTF